RHGSDLRVRGAGHAGYRRGRRERHFRAQHRPRRAVEENRGGEARRDRGVTTTNWRAIWAVYAGGLVTGAYMTKVPPALPQMRDEFGLSLVESGLIVTTFNVLGMLVGVLAGMAGDRFGC